MPKSKSNDALMEKIARLGDEPGVYLWKDRRGGVLYVGKAKSLKKRVASYFAPSGPRPIKTDLLVSRIADLDYVVCGSEMEAFMLESDLIKKLQPKYNVNLKDAKSYPFLKLTLGEEFPRLIFTRKQENDGSAYFGPYSSARDLRDTMRFLQKTFPLRQCEKLKKEVCLYYYINKCEGPCVFEEAAGGYAAHVDSVKEFLEGKQKKTVDKLRGEMRRASAEMKFEKAALARDRLTALEALRERQRVVSGSNVEMDAVGAAVDGGTACVQLLQVREGRLKGQETFYFDLPEGDGPAEALGAFIRRHYTGARSIPPEVATSHPVEDAELFEAFLTGLRGKRRRVTHPRRGRKRELTDMALENARLKLKRRRIAELESDRPERDALEDLREMLGLDRPIERMSGADISTVQGVHTVGSVVSFKDGVPDKSQYRRFRIRGSGADDFSSMREMMSRYFARLQKGDFAPPDVVAIDGGPGQLSAARAAAEASGMSGRFALISFAKESQSIYRAEGGGPTPVLENSEIGKLLKRLMLEAHRFAITYHRERRGKGMLSS